MNPFRKQTGADKIDQPLVYFTLFLSLVSLSYVIARGGFVALAGIILLPFVVIFLISIVVRPEIAFFAALVSNFIANGLTRYIIGAPFGLAVDIFLLLTYVALFFKYFYSTINWSLAKNDLTFAALIWYAYTVLELFNPEAISISLWFYFMRGTAMYMVLTVVIVFLLLDKIKYLKYFLYVWCTFEILGSIKAIMQLTIGLDPFEQYWLDTVGRSTHLLFGELRAFSFFSDAGQFGASQAHTAMVAAIIALTTKNVKDRVFFIITAAFCFYGMFNSGTRGIWGVLFGATFLFLILNRNYKAFIIGLILASSVFVFFKYTYLANNIYFINRMRTAFDPKNASLIARLENQARLRPYLAVRPFGGGIGHAGVKAQQFTPNTFLASIATDSWYVQIWAEEGIVGLILHLSILLYIIFKGGYLIIRIRDHDLRYTMIALMAGIVGILVSSYGNGVYGQMPTSLLVYSSMAFIFMSPKLDDELALISKPSD